MAYSGRVDLLAARPIGQRAVGTCWVMCRRDNRRAGRAGDPVQPCEIPRTDQGKFNAAQQSPVDPCAGRSRNRIVLLVL